MRCIFPGSGAVHHRGRLGSDPAPPAGDDAMLRALIVAGAAVEARETMAAAAMTQRRGTPTGFLRQSS